MSEKLRIQLSEATLGDSKREDGLKLDLRYVTGKDKDIPTLHISQRIQNVIPPDSLFEYLEMLDETWLNPEAPMPDCSLISESFLSWSFIKKLYGSFVYLTDAWNALQLDAILVYALHVHRRDKCQVFYDVPILWESQNISYMGKLDYLIGNSIKDAQILVVKAESEWPSHAVNRALAKAGCLMRKRLDTGKKSRVYLILTNYRFFKFYSIDTNGIVYSSGPELVLSRDTSWKSSESLKQVWKWLMYILQEVTEDNAARIIQQHCENWLWKPVCKDGKPGIHAELLRKHVEN